MWLSRLLLEGYSCVVPKRHGAADRTVLDGVTGILSGTPASGGGYHVTVHVLDSKGATVEKTYPLTITPQLVFASKGLSDGISGGAYREALSASGGAPPYTFS